MIDYRVKFEEIKDKSPNELVRMIMERDKLCKNTIMKLYRKYGGNRNLGKNLSKAYESFYSKTIWKECVLPLLVAYGINKKIIPKRMICPNCATELKSWLQIIPHHKKYPSLSEKWNYNGFDNRMNFNHPDKIHFMCVYCHSPFHDYLKLNSLSVDEVKYSYLEFYSYE